MSTFLQNTESPKARFYLHDEIGRLAICHASAHAHKRPQEEARNEVTIPRWRGGDIQIFDMMENVHIATRREESNKRVFVPRVGEGDNNHCSHSNKIAEIRADFWFIKVHKVSTDE